VGGWCCCRCCRRRGGFSGVTVTTSPVWCCSSRPGTDSVVTNEQPAAASSSGGGDIVCSRVGDRQQAKPKSLKVWQCRHKSRFLDDDTLFPLSKPTKTLLPSSRLFSFLLSMEERCPPPLDQKDDRRGTVNPPPDLPPTHTDHESLFVCGVSTLFRFVRRCDGNNGGERGERGEEHKVKWTAFFSRANFETL
jgi:hypothetical protein